MVLYLAWILEKVPMVFDWSLVPFRYSLFFFTKSYWQVFKIRILDRRMTSRGVGDIKTNYSCPCLYCEECGFYGTMFFWQLFILKSLQLKPYANSYLNNGLSSSIKYHTFIKIFIIKGQIFIFGTLNLK